MIIFFIPMMTFYSCSETLDKAKEGFSSLEKMSSNDVDREEDTQSIVGLPPILGSLVFTEETVLKNGLKGTHQQEGQYRSAFQSNGAFELCGAMLDSRRVQGDVSSLPDLPKGMVRGHKVNQSKSTLALYGYRGVWRQVGQWQIGTITERSGKGSCEGKFKSFSGGQFWCYKLSSKPLKDAVLCGFEKPPFRSVWKTSLPISILTEDISIPIEAKNQSIHWAILGSLNGVHWEWQKIGDTAKNTFTPKSIVFDLQPFKEKSK